MRTRKTFLVKSGLSGGLMLSLGLAGCGANPAGTQAGQGRLDGDDPFLTQARLALISYLEADASFNDTLAYAGRGFSTQRFAAAAEGDAGDEDGEDENDLDLIGGLGADAALTSQLSGQINGILNTQLGGLGNFSAAHALFDRAAGAFSARLLGAPGVSLASGNAIQINAAQLSAGIRADLASDVELSNASLDLGGQLTAYAKGDLRLAELNPLGYSGSSSNVVSQNASDGRTQAVLLSFRNRDADLINQVRMISKTGLSGSQRSEYDLRLESQSAAFTRTGLRELGRDAAGQATIRSDLSMQLDQGSQIELLEQRFVNAQGAGSGVGSFTITTGGTTWNGSLRSVSAADGRLLLLLEPADTGRGRLVLQEKANGRADLLLYDSAGNLAARRELDLEAEIDALARG